jgi:hypothetical protein
VKRRDIGFEALCSAVESWKGKRVLVFGDMILDEFILGRTALFPRGRGERGS